MIISLFVLLVYAGGLEKAYEAARAKGMYKFPAFWDAIGWPANLGALLWRLCKDELP